MKFKGFVILPEYYVGSTFTVNENTGAVKNRKPTNKDIEYYVIYDPMEGMKRWIAEFTVQQCKTTILDFLHKVNMKDNNPSSWAKLEMSEL